MRPLAKHVQASVTAVQCRFSGHPAAVSPPAGPSAASHVQARQPAIAPRVGAPPRAPAAHVQACLAAVPGRRSPGAAAPPVQPCRKPATQAGSHPPRTIQREVSFRGEFGRGGSDYQRALLSLYRIDQADLTQEEVRRHGLDRLIVPLLPKLLCLRGTDLVFDAKEPWDEGSQRQVASGAAGAVTELFMKPRGRAESVDLDTRDGKALFQAREVERFQLKITIVYPTGRRALPTTYADILQILNHEMSVHAENFADLIEAYWSGRPAVLKTSGTEHHEYHQHQVARYSQLKDRILSDLTPEDRETYAMREGADRFFMNKTPKDPVVFRW